MSLRARLTVLGMVVLAVLLLAAPVVGAMTATQVARLVAADRVVGDSFGDAVAASGDVIAVGAPGRSVDTLA